MSVHLTQDSLPTRPVEEGGLWAGQHKLVPQLGGFAVLRMKLVNGQQVEFRPEPSVLG